MKTIIVCEKPDVARKVRNAITDASVDVVAARGHLLEIAFFEEKNRWTYPSVDFDNITLVPIPEAKQVLDNIVKVCRNADVIVSATDLDREGSSIFMEIYKHMVTEYGLSKDVQLKRMKMSSLTESEIKKAWANLDDYDWGRSYAGFTRNVQDMFWGVNLTRALTIATHGFLGTLSGGRVQTPMLKLISDRDREIEKFVPQSYFQLQLMAEYGGKEFDLIYEGKLKTLDEVKDVVNLIKVGDKVEASVDEKEHQTPPPPPFNGTTLQIEGNRVLGYSAKEIADRSNGIAQGLYSKALISYPGTDSEKYPADWTTADWDAFKELLGKYFSRPNLPRPKAVEGPTEDPAHPCMRVVALPPNDLSDKEKKLYGLIASRNAAGFCKPYVESVKTIKVKIGKHSFKAVGKTPIDEGWRVMYPYTRTQEKTLPNVKDGNKVALAGTRHQKKETQPPAKFNTISLIAQCDKLGLGTKNTRPSIIEKLSERGYVEASSGKKTVLASTENGHKVIDVLGKYAELMTDTQLTELFTTTMDGIEKDPKSYESANKKLIKVLADLMYAFKNNENKIGFDLTGLEINETIQCPECGKDTTIRSSKDGKYRFFGCSGYPDCKKSLFFDKEEKIRTGMRCECGMPLLSGIIPDRSGDKDYVRCLNDSCGKSPIRCPKCHKAMRVARSKNNDKMYALCKDCSVFNFYLATETIKMVEK